MFNRPNLNHVIDLVLSHLSKSKEGSPVQMFISIDEHGGPFVCDSASSPLYTLVTLATRDRKVIRKAVKEALDILETKYVTKRKDRDNPWDKRSTTSNKEHGGDFDS